MWGYVAASIAGSLLGNSMTNKANLRNTRENNSHQLMMSNTAHQREVKDLKSAGLNPILSARSAGAPVGSSAAAKVEPIKPNVGQALVEAEQIKLLQAQSDKTRAEAVNTKLQEPYNRALADLYSSIAGGAVVTGKALGGVATGMGMYQGAKALNRFIKARRVKRLSKPSFPKPSSRKFKRSRGGSNSRSAIRRKSGLKFHEKVDRSTGEIKPRFNRAEALRKASKSTKYGLRRFGGRRRIRF
jgi:hypothetical protein